MNEIVVNKHNFEVAKSQVSKMARNRAEVPKLSPFQVDGALFGLMDHRVTGPEINQQLVSPLQQSISSINLEFGKLYNIAGQIYKAMDYLDGEYMEGIVKGLNSANAASDQALKAANKALDAQKSADEGIRKAQNASKQALDAQEGLKQSFIALEAIVKKLEQFKLKSESDVRSMQNDIQQVRRSVEQCQNTLQQAQDVMGRTINNLQGTLTQNIEQVRSNVENDTKRMRDDIERFQQRTEDDIKGQLSQMQQKFNADAQQTTMSIERQFAEMKGLSSQDKVRQANSKATVATVVAAVASVVSVVSIVLAIVL